MSAGAKYVPNNKDFGLFIMTRANPAAREARRLARATALIANQQALMYTTTGAERRKWRKLRLDPMKMTKLAGSYKVAETVWVSKAGTPRAAYSVYSDARSAPFNESGGGKNKDSPRPRHILANAAQRVAAATGGRPKAW